ncbi:MAG TPA: Tad domain-containing protein [Candidatus Obscuribacterales bacterium]
MHSRKRATSCGSRATRGSVLPVVTFALILVVAFLGLAIDVMRNFLAARQLQFAAQSAALYGLSFATNQDGTYRDEDARNNVRVRIMAAGSAGAGAWNRAPAGPQDGGSQWFSPVRLSAADVTFIDNPEDSSEFFVRVAARRDSEDALTLLFMPALHAMNSLMGQPVPELARKASPYRVAEVVGQPASRIGPGAPLDASPGSRAAELARFAALPLAVSNEQFAQAAEPGQNRTRYVVDLVSSATATQATQPGHLKGAFVNLVPGGGTSAYYGDGQGEAAIDELVRLLDYFGDGRNPLAPAAVERGSRLAAFDPSDPVFAARKQEIVTALRRLPLHRPYIVPVVRNDPEFSSGNEVVGFARLILVQAIESGSGEIALTMQATESVPVRNASFANGARFVGSPGAVMLPAPVAPFQARTWLVGSNGLSARPRAVVLAPSLSPRLLGQIN